MVATAIRQANTTWMHRRSNTDKLSLFSGRAGRIARRCTASPSRASERECLSGRVTDAQRRLRPQVDTDFEELAAYGHAATRQRTITAMSASLTPCPQLMRDRLWRDYPVRDVIRGVWSAGGEALDPDGATPNSPGSEGGTTKTSKPANEDRETRRTPSRMPVSPGGPEPSGS